MDGYTFNERRTYQLHEATPLAVAEMPKSKPEVESGYDILRCGTRRKPPHANDKVAHFSFRNGLGVLVLLAKQSVLILKVESNVGLCVFLEGLSPVKEARSLLVFHGHRCIFVSVDNTDSIPIGLSAICHKPFEVWLKNIVASHNSVEVFSNHNLSSGILELHVTDGNGHYSTKGGIINMARHCSPTLHTLNMVKHEPGVFEVSTGLHPFHEVDSTTRSYLIHFEHKDLAYISLKVLSGIS
jgi:hypothetical protein